MAAGTGSPVVEQQAAAVYVIVNPNLRASAEWPRIRAELAARVKGAPLAAFGDLFADSADYQARWPDVVRDLAGAVVVPSIDSGRLLAGRVALREAAAVSQAGKPVFLATPRGLVPWGKVEARRQKGPRWAEAELIVPGGEVAR
jgi:hypothetical protein